MDLPRPRIVIVGNGMVGHRLVEALVERGVPKSHRVTVLAEEPRPAYDRVNLSKCFDGAMPADLALADVAHYLRNEVEIHLGDPVVGIDREARTVRCASGRTEPYDTLVLATGSMPFVPPVEGRQAQRCFVYRTIEDLEAIAAAARTSRVGAVIGGGLLGLEAANALRNLGLETHVIEFAPRLMALQLDDVGGTLLRQKIEALGVHVHTGKNTRAITTDAAGGVSGLAFADGDALATDLVVFSAGIRAQDALARAIGLEVGARGGVTVDDRCRTSDPAIFAVGECACYDGRTYGLVAPGYRMAEVVAANLAGADERLAPFDLSTKLKLLGVEVASFGDAFAQTPGVHVVSYFDALAGVYKKLVVSADKKRLLGGILVGDAGAYTQLVGMMKAGSALPEHPEGLILPATGGGAKHGPEHLPDEALICSCHNVTKGAICETIRAQGLRAVGDVKSCTKAGTGCGSCTTLLAPILNAELTKAGIGVCKDLCEHFPYSRQELFHLTKLHGIRTFDELVTRHGRGHGCEICKPAVASILASLWNEHILAKPHVGLQDTNDRYLANIQRDGTYSVVPRVAGGEITPRQLIALGEVAEKYGLYTKITGGQRVDLFGARLELLPEIWSELIAAGFESGHAYGKALRTVKSCVGSTWCRYGVQDSVGLAIKVENRYKGLRSPHKLKGAVSGCARECAEAQGKDFGIIATDKGYNLYVCGNGGMRPQHAQLLYADADEETVIRLLDRFLMFYVRTADRLQRTSTWLNGLEGGIEYVKQVVVHDSLGIAGELEADMARVVETYRCEWKAAIEDPEKRKQFRSFVNSDEADPSIVFVKERDQHRPAFWDEKSTASLVRLRRPAEVAATRSTP